MKSVKEVKRREYYIFSPFLRIFHWIMVAMILVLFLTGMVITKPMNVTTIEPFFSITSMDLVRDIHFVAAFIFCAAFILRIYGFIVNKGDRLFPRFLEGHFYSETVEVALHYMLIKPEHSSFLILISRSFPETRRSLSSRDLVLLTAAQINSLSPQRAEHTICFTR